MISFEPMSAATVSISVGASSANIQIPNMAGGEQVRVMNNGTQTAWVEFGGSGVAAATATSIPVPAGAVEVFSVPNVSGAVYAAAIAAGATGSIYFTPGSGI